MTLVGMLVLLSLTFAIRLTLQKRTEVRNEQDVLPLIHEAAATHDLPVTLVRALVWKESRFNPNAVGSKKEIGLMQITDGAVTDWANNHHRNKPNRKERFDPATNLDIGCWYLARAGHHWDGYASRDILQLAEYNAGRTKVLRDWKPEDPAQEILLEQITFPGTQDYVRQILKQRQFYDDQEIPQPSPSVNHDDP